MTHWSEFLSAAIVHAECMKYTQIALDPMQMLAAVQQAQQQASRFSNVLSSPFDPRLVSAR